MFITKLERALLTLGVVLALAPLRAGGDPKFRLPALATADLEAGVNNFDRYYTVDKIPGGWSVIVEGWNKGAYYRTSELPDLPDAAAETQGGFVPFGSLHGQYYWRAVEPGWGKLHADGLLMPEAMLAEYFFNTIFQYNLNRFTGFDPNYNYSQLQGQMNNLYPFERRHLQAMHILLNCPLPEQESDLPSFLAWLPALKRAQAAWRQNTDFMTLGTAYMRQKVVVEKLSEGARRPQNGQEPEAIFKVMMAKDRVCQDLQTMIFSWMKEAFGTYVDRCHGKAPEPEADVESFFATTKPSFLEQPYYADLMAKAKGLGQR